MTDIAALVTLHLTVAAAAAAARTSAAAIAAARTSATATARTATAGEFYAPTMTTVDLATSIIGIAGILELDKSKPWGFACNPHTAQGTELPKLIFKLALGDASIKVTDVHFG